MMVATILENRRDCHDPGHVGVDDRSCLASLLFYTYHLDFSISPTENLNLSGNDYAIRECLRPHRMEISLLDWCSVWLMNGNRWHVR